MKNFYLLLSGLMLSPVLSTVSKAESKGTVNVRIFDEEYSFGGSFFGVSSNGRYAVGHSRDFTQQAFIWDRETDEFTRIEGSYNGIAYANGVSDDGTVVGAYLDETVLSNYGEPAIIPGLWKDGVWLPLERIAGSSLFGQGMDGEAKCISADGRIIGGYLADGNRHYLPAVWIDGVLQPYGGDPVEGQGSFIWAMSQDGSVWGGKAEFESGAASPAVWTQNGKLTRVAGEVWNDEQEYFFYGITGSISPSGEYAAGYFSYNGASAQQPFVWSKDGGRLYIAEEGTSTVVTDAGTVYGVDGYLGSPFIYKEGQINNLTDQLKETYDYLSEDYVQYVLATSRNEFVLAGWTAVEHSMGTVMQPALAVIDAPQGIASSATENDIQVIVNGNQIRVMNADEGADIKLYDMAGRCIVAFQDGREGAYVPSPGVYMLKTMNNSNLISRKVFVK